MSRELKFRAWDGERMWTPDFIYEDGRPGLSLGKQANLYDNPVMQFIGLLDKNGVELYEGDRVNTFKSPVLEVRLEPPCMDYKGARIEYVGSGYYLLGPPGSTPLDEYVGPDGISALVEIIGNVHQDSHLLTSHKNRVENL